MIAELRGSSSRVAATEALRAEMQQARAQVEELEENVAQVGTCQQDVFRGFNSAEHPLLETMGKFSPLLGIHPLSMWKKYVPPVTHY